MVCANVWEDSAVPVDVAVAPFEASIFRQATEHLVVAQIRAELRALNDEQQRFEAERARSSGSPSARSDAKSTKVGAKEVAQRERLRQRANGLQQAWEARMTSIRQKAALAKGEAKARHQQHLEELARLAATQEAIFNELFA